MIITYNGQTYESLIWEQVSEEERMQLQKQYFSKPDFSIVLQQFKKISKDGVMIDKITKYYFRDLMAKTKIKGAKWTVEDVFNSTDLLGIFKARTKTNSSIFTSNDLITNIDTAIRLGGHNIAGFPPQFPMKTVRNILNKYNINNNYYDFSCGWGARLLGAISRSINYYGTDPNYLLMERLSQLYLDYKKYITTDSVVELNTQGSEFFITNWENKMGLAFSSPPYFDLEDYQIGKQSYSIGTTYESWKKDYVIPTFQNIYHYLIDDGIFALNIKNNKTYALADDMKKIAIDNGFELIDIELLTNNQRNTPSGLLNNAENIFIFKKNKSLSINGFSFVSSASTLSNTINNDINTQHNILTSDSEQQIDIYLVGVKSKKQLDDPNIYNINEIWYGERYFSTFNIQIYHALSFLKKYVINKYIEITKENAIEMLEYIIYHKDSQNSFKSVPKLCEIIDTWDEMEKNNFHLFLQITYN